MTQSTIDLNKDTQSYWEHQLEAAYSLRDIKRQAYYTAKGTLRNIRNSGQITRNMYYTELQKLKAEHAKEMDKVFDSIRTCKDKIKLFTTA